jgi:hypothetical protein
VVAAVVAARRRDEAAEGGAPVDPGIGTVRRIFLYGLAFVSLMFGALGLAMLLAGAIDAALGRVVLASNDTRLAIALAFTIVGVPSWLAFAFVAQRTVIQHDVERRSQARRLYVDLVRAVALGVLIVTGIMISWMLLRVDDAQGGPWGWFVAWAGVWLLHERLAATEPAATATTRLLDRLYLYLGALLGLYTLAFGVMIAIQTPLTAAYDDLIRETVVESGWSEDLRSGLGVAIVGGLAWAWHWLRFLWRRDARSTMWFTYIFLAGIAFGMAATISPLAGSLYLVLRWWFGNPEAATAAEHFRDIPAIAAMFVVGAAAWGYHRAALREGLLGEDTPWSQPERIYRYLAATAGLVTLATGLTMLIAVALDAVTPKGDALLRGADAWRDSLVLGITLVIVGVPLWARYWFQTQQEATERGEVERSSLPRRIFLFAIFGLAALIAIVDLTVILYTLFEGMLEGTLSSEVIRDPRWSVALVLVAGAVGVHYWLVMREDQAASAAEVPEASGAVPVTVRRRSVTVLAPDGAEDLREVIAAIPGVSLRAWRRLDAVSPAPVIDAARLDDLRVAIAEADADQILVLVRDGTFEVIPYRD